jgi:hypothetical protein
VAMSTPRSFPCHTRLVWPPHALTCKIRSLSYLLHAHADIQHVHVHVHAVWRKLGVCVHGRAASLLAPPLFASSG